MKTKNQRQTKTTSSLNLRERSRDMKKLIKAFIKGEQGVNTLEIIIIAAVLVAVAIIFRKALMSFVKGLMDPVFNHYEEITEGMTVL